MLYLVLKWLHVLGAILFLGVGAGSAWYKLRGSHSGDPKVVAWASREIVLADWLFTVPSALIMPITGLWMASLMKMPWLEGFVGVGVFGFPVLPQRSSGDYPHVLPPWDRCSVFPWWEQGFLQKDA